MPGMTSMSAVHEQMQERTSEYQEEKPPIQDVGTMFGEEQESGDCEQDQKGNAGSRLQKSTS
jgi:hypothetical protein